MLPTTLLNHGVMSDPEQHVQKLMMAYPGLQYDGEHQIVHGAISFECCYEPNVKFQHHISESSYLRDSPHFISDTHQVAIFVGYGKAGSGLGGHPPTYILDNNRIERILKEQGLRTKNDLHISTDNSCCLMLGEPEISNLPLHQFVDEAVLPWLYRLSYVERFGLDAARDNLWGEYSHGRAGVQEWLTEHAGMAAKARTMKGVCPCGSGRRFKRCHDPILKKMARQATGNF